MLRTNETERYSVCVRFFREHLALLHEWWCREEQDQMRKIRWRRNTRSTTKVTRKGFARETGSRFSASAAGRKWRSFSRPVGRLLQIATSIIISLLCSLIVSRKWLTVIRIDADTILSRSYFTYISFIWYFISIIKVF